MKRLFGFVLAFILMINYLTFAGALQTQAQELEQCEASIETAEITDAKLYCDATLEDDFEESEIIITFTEEASVVNKVYTVTEFCEIFDVDFTYVEDLSYISTESGLARIDPDKYNQIFLVRLVDAGKQAVLDAIKIIEQHPYVRSAEPNGYHYAD